MNKFDFNFYFFLKAYQTTLTQLKIFLMYLADGIVRARTVI